MGQYFPPLKLLEPEFYCFLCCKPVFCSSIGFAHHDCERPVAYLYLSLHRYSNPRILDGEPSSRTMSPRSLLPATHLAYLPFN